MNGETVSLLGAAALAICGIVAAVLAGVLIGLNREATPRTRIVVFALLVVLAAGFSIQWVIEAIGATTTNTERVSTGLLRLVIAAVLAILATVIWQDEQTNGPDMTTGEEMGDDHAT